MLCLNLQIESVLLYIKSTKQSFEINFYTLCLINADSQCIVTYLLKISFKIGIQGKRESKLFLVTWPSLGIFSKLSRCFQTDI